MNTLKWQCSKCGDESETRDMNTNNIPTTCYSCCISAKYDQEAVSNEEMDDTTCRDLVEDSGANYENSQCAIATGEISYEFGVR
jgi:hypothetical protein